MKAFSGRFAAAVLGSAAGRFLRIAEQLLLVPLYIRAWGIDGYGAWILLMYGASFVTLANGGIGYAASADIVMAHARGDHDTVSRVFSTAGTLIAGVIVVTAVLVLAAVTLIDPRLPAPIGTSGPLIVGLLSSGLLLAFFIEPLAGVLGAVRGAGLPMQMQALVKAGELLVVGLALLARLPPLAVAVIFAVSSLAGVLLHGWLAFRLAPWLRLERGRCDPEAVRRNWRAALGFFGLAFAVNVINLQAPRLIVGIFAGPAALSAFTVFITYTRTARSLAAVIAQALQVEVGRLAGAGQFEALRPVFRAAIGRSSALGLLLIGGVLLVAPWFIPAWTHGKIAVAWPLLAILALVAMVGTVFDAELALAAGMNRVARLAVYYGAGSMSAMLLALAGARWSGRVEPVALAMLISEIVGVYAASRLLWRFIGRPS